MPTGTGRSPRPGTPSPARGFARIRSARRAASPSGPRSPREYRAVGDQGLVVESAPVVTAPAGRNGEEVRRLQVHRRPPPPTLPARPAERHAQNVAASRRPAPLINRAGRDHLHMGRAVTARVD